MRAMRDRLALIVTVLIVSPWTLPLQFSIDVRTLLPARSFGYRLWMLRHGWTRRVEAALAPTGLTHMQFFVMRALEHCAHEPPSQTTLAEVMQVDRMTISKVVRTLEGKGLLTRAPHPADPRANVLAMTERATRPGAGGGARH